MKPVTRQPGRLRLTQGYKVAGVPCIVTASPAILEVIDDTYGSYADFSVTPADHALTVAEGDESVLLVETGAPDTPCRDEREAAFLLVERIARHATAELAVRGVYAIHGASLVHRGGAVIISGRSGAGKTTLALALVDRGLRLLSDELALSAPDARTILPYRRGLHIRPGTPELVAPLAFMAERPFHPLSGGFQWTLRSDELERTFPSCFAHAAPLRHVVIVDGRRGGGPSVLESLPAGVAAVELLASTTVAATDFQGAIERTTRLVTGVRCARMKSGTLESSIEVLLDWLARDDRTTQG